MKTKKTPQFLAPSGALVFILVYYIHPQSTFPKFSNLEQSCLYEFIIHFHFHSVFDIQNRTRQYFCMNYIDNACKKRALSNLHPALKLQEGSVVRTAGKECGETTRWLKATTAERACHSLQSKQRFTPLVSFLLLSQLSIVTLSLWSSCAILHKVVMIWHCEAGHILARILLFLNFLTSYNCFL